MYHPQNTGAAATAPLPELLTPQTVEHEELLIGAVATQRGKRFWTSAEISGVVVIDGRTYQFRHYLKKIALKRR